MKRQEPTKPATGEPQWYTATARPPTPGELTKAEPADITTEPEKHTGLSSRRVGWIVGIYVVVASVEVALGRWFDSIYWAAVALFFAVSLQPRERVPKLLRYFAAAALLVLTAVQVVLLILKLKGH